MYYQKFSEINKSFKEKEFDTVALMWAVTISYSFLMAFACFTIESNPPAFLSFPVHIWPEHPVICCLLGTLVLIVSLVFYLASDNMYTKRDPVKKQLARIYLVISNILFPTFIFTWLLRILCWLITNAAYMVINLIIWAFYDFPYWVVKVMTPAEPKKPKQPKHDLKTVLNDVEALVKR